MLELRRDLQKHPCLLISGASTQAENLPARLRDAASSWQPWLISKCTRERFI